MDNAGRFRHYDPVHKDSGKREIKSLVTGQGNPCPQWRRLRQAYGKDLMKVKCRSVLWLPVDACTLLLHVQIFQMIAQAIIRHLFTVL